MNKNLTHAVRNPWFVPVSSILTLHRHRWLLVELFLDKRISIITDQSCYWPKYSFLSVCDLCLRWNGQLWTIWKNLIKSSIMSEVYFIKMVDPEKKITGIICPWNEYIQITFVWSCTLFPFCCFFLPCTYQFRISVLI